MAYKINRELLPIKAHYFFFFAALGPLLPQMNVFGRQLGVSPGAMGLVTAVLPLLWATAKPFFGYIVDYFTNQRKLVFMLLIAVMTGSYCCLWFLPQEEPPPKPYIIPNNTLFLRRYQNDTASEKFSCRWHCLNNNTFQVFMLNSPNTNILYLDGELTNNSCSLVQMNFNNEQRDQIACTPADGCDLHCLSVNKTGLVGPTGKGDHRKSDLVVLAQSNKLPVQLANDTPVLVPDEYDLSFYKSKVFWSFVVLMCLGTVAFNVANCIADAICFDVLGESRASAYGRQRAWGTVGYGVTALLAGYLVDLVTPDGSYKDFTPAFVLAMVFTAFDLVCCRALKLPALSSPNDSGKALLEVLRMPKVLIFIAFAVVAGTFDSFIIYYMFWFLEELAETTGHSAKIKMIEGTVVAAESLVGELVFFYFSGKIIKRWGYAATMSFSLFCYAARLAFISCITNPWQLVIIEGVMQGPTYALCYSCIVGTAARVAPPGYSATVQGLVAGMDDGLGFAIGSLLGGLLYSSAGGKQSFRIMAVAAAAAGGLHALLTCGGDRGHISKPELPASPTEEDEKMLPLSPLHINGNSIYNDTVVPLTAVVKPV